VPSAGSRSASGSSTVRPTTALVRLVRSELTLGAPTVLGTFAIGLVVSSSDPALARNDGTALSSPFVVAIERAQIHVRSPTSLRLVALADSRLPSCAQTLPSVVNAAFLTAATSAASSGLYTASRCLYGLALNDNAPRVFARLNRYGLPYVAVSTGIAFGSLAFMSVRRLSSSFPLPHSSSSRSVALQAGTHDAAVVFGWLASFCAVGGLLSWACICFCYIRASSLSLSLIQASRRRADDVDRSQASSTRPRRRTSRGTSSPTALLSSPTQPTSPSSYVPRLQLLLSRPSTLISSTGRRRASRSSSSSKASTSSSPGTGTRPTSSHGTSWSSSSRSSTSAPDGGRSARRSTSSRSTSSAARASASTSPSPSLSPSPHSRDDEADDETTMQQRRDARVGRQEQVEESALGAGLSAAVDGGAAVAGSLSWALSFSLSFSSIAMKLSVHDPLDIGLARSPSSSTRSTESYRIAIPPTPLSTPPSPAPLPLTLNGSASRPVLSR